MFMHKALGLALNYMYMYNQTLLHDIEQVTVDMVCHYVQNHLHVTQFRTMIFVKTVGM